MRTSLIGLTISFSILALCAQAQTPTFTAAGVLNAASMTAGTLAPGERVVINGTNLGDPSFFRNCAVTYPVTTNCFGTMVLVNGTPAPVINTAANLLTFQVPFGVTGSNATIQVTSNLSGSTLSSGMVTVPIAPTAPGLFTLSGSGTGTGYYYVTGGLITQYSQPVLVGDTVVLFATGFGATNPAVATGNLGPNTPAGSAATATMTINNQTTAVTFAGLVPGNVTGAALGYDEVVFTVPSGLPIPTGQQEASFPVVVTVGGVQSPPVNLRVGVTPPAITSISPNPVPLSANPQTVTFNGSGFQNGLSVLVAGPNGQRTTINAANVTFVSSSQFTIQLTVGTTEGTWSAAVNNPNGSQSDTFVFTASGTAPASTISFVVTTSSFTPQIAQNTWIEVHGSNLAQQVLLWNSLPPSAFTTNLPTSLGGVSATVNGKAAAVYYVSPTQVNLLAPIDTATGSVTVQLNTPSGQTSAFPVTELPLSPAFFVIDPPNGHVAARHLDYSLLGPSSLNQPGYTFTPAKPGETILLYATGFGQTNPAVANQLLDVGSALPALPAVTIGNSPAQVMFAGISSAGLYQFNVVVPTGLPAGDATLTATYNGSVTQTGVLLTIGQ